MIGRGRPVGIKPLIGTVRGKNSGENRRKEEEKKEEKTGFTYMFLETAGYQERALVLGSIRE